MADLEITNVHSSKIDRSAGENDAEFSRETGFPSPARDHYEKPLSLDEHLIHRPAATYFLRVKGDDLNSIGIYSEDILVVDRSIEPRSGHLVVVRLQGQNTLRKLERKNGQMFFCSGIPNKRDVRVSEEKDHEIWGVVSYTIHKHI